MVKSKKLRGGSICNANPNVSVYNTPCSGLPLDSQFQQQFMVDTRGLQNGGGYFLDIGNPNPVNPMDAPVQGYSECCHPLFNTQVGSTNMVDNSNAVANSNNANNSTLFNASGYAVGSNGNPICGGGRKSPSGTRRTKKGKAKNTAARGYSNKQTRLKISRMEKTLEKIEGKIQECACMMNSKKKSKKGKKKQKGGQRSIFSGDMNVRTFNCSQPNWNASCV